MPVSLAPELWEAFFAESPDPCFAYEVGQEPRFTLIAVNKAWREATGMTTDALGMSLLTHLPPALSAVVAERFERCIAERESASFDEELPFGGEARHWRTTLSPILRDGEVRYIVGFGHDYTDLRHTTNALADSEAKFRRLVENASDIVYRLRYEPSFRLDYISPSVEQVSGYAPEEFYRDPDLLRRLFVPEDLGEIERTRAELGAARAVLLGRWRHKDGSLRWVEARSTAVLDDSGRVVAREGIARDITEQRLRDDERQQLERRLQQTQKLESLGILAGGIAHDFNNLLTGILGHISLLRSDPGCNETLEEHAAQVELAATRAAELCRQMLAYSGKGRFAVERLELDDLVRETTQLLTLSVAKTTTLELRLEASRAVVAADPSQLQQVVMNLVLNASEAYGGRPGIVRVTTGVTSVTREELREGFVAPDLPGGSYVILDVSDDGAGMSPDTASRIFDPFFTTKLTGRGLGLSAVLGIVRGHAGAIRVESVPGRGTKFRVLLPLSHGEPRRLDSSRRPPTPRGSGRILVVDDEEVVRTVTGRILQSLGYGVTLVSDGERAVKVFEDASEPFDAVLMDLTMPRLDGVATFEKLRRLDPRVVVILMTGYSEQDAVARFSGSGLAGFLQKPFTTDLLSERLAGALRKG